MLGLVLGALIQVTVADPTLLVWAAPFALLGVAEAYRSAGARAGQGLRSLSVTATHEVVGFMHQDRQVRGRIREVRIVTRGIVVLRVRWEAAISPTYLWILADEVSHPDQFRRLMLLLRWGRPIVQARHEKK